MDLFAPFRKWVNPRLWKKYIDFLNKDKSQTVQLTFLDGTVVVADEFKPKFQGTVMPPIVS